jgi:pilus assembly protein Flp/PilA
MCTDLAWRFIKEEEGQGMVEYGLIVALVAIVVIAALTIMGPKIKNVFNKVTNSLS